MVFVVEHWTTNILPTNEATSTTFTCSTSSNHENKIHELSKYCSTTDILPPPPKITRYTVPTWRESHDGEDSVQLVVMVRAARFNVFLSAMENWFKSEQLGEYTTNGPNVWSEKRVKLRGQNKNGMHCTYIVLCSMLSSAYFNNCTTD